MEPRVLELALAAINTEVDRDTGGVNFLMWNQDRSQMVKLKVTFAGAQLVARCAFDVVRMAEAFILVPPAAPGSPPEGDQQPPQESELLLARQVGLVRKDSGAAHLRFHTTEGYVANVMLSPALADQLAAALLRPPPDAPPPH